MYQFPISTYRIQFNAKFTFQNAIGIVKYLQSLGISHCYASPIFRTKPGSLHGYDILDHSQLNPELGSEQDFESLIQALRSSQMGMIVDIVPNHMYAVDCTNRWWGDVLENGPSSPYADYFDIDWNPPWTELVNKVLLPLLEEQYGTALESQTLKGQYRDGSFFIEMPGIILPTDPRSWSLLLEPVCHIVEAQVAEADPHLLELQSIITAITHLPLATDSDKEKVLERQREKEVIKRRLASIVDASPVIQKVLTDAIDALNGTKGDLESFDSLEKFLNAQCYRLCFWRVANDEINYRRFFDILSLAGIRTEKSDVFEAVHSLVFQMIEKQQIDGVRVDHIDGLWNPERYFKDFQAHCSKTGIAANNKEELFYVIGEKILIGNEKIRPQWLMHGTTGYDFLNLVNGLFVMQANRKAIFETYLAFTEVSLKISEHIYASKKLVLLSSMSGELHVLSRHLDRISEQHRSSRDFTTESLRAALRDTIAFFSVYRSYIDAGISPIHKEDREYICMAINRAKKRNPATSSSIFDFVQSVLLLEHPAGLTDEQINEREVFVMRFQQLTGPVMAKGFEDTMFYRFFPLASLNEVGTDPYAFGITTEAFHEKSCERRELWPHTLLATSTHDTKRSEDVRARINVLSEIPDEWHKTLNRWKELNQKFKIKDVEDVVPDANEEYLLYQTLVGTWPLYPMDPAMHIKYMSRIQAYMEKAIKEAKINSSWINPNTAYSQKVKQFIHNVLELDSTANPFLADFNEFISKIVTAGMLNSLSQLLIKLTSPGVPDLYQGNEVWDFSLVDPDNRREVDFENRIYLLQSIQEGMKKQPKELLQQLVQSPEDGRIKLFITTKVLQLRKKEHELFNRGSYIPLKIKGERQTHIISYAWVFKDRTFVIITSRFFMPLLEENSFVINPAVWEETAVILPKEIRSHSFRNVFTKDTIRAESLDDGAAIHLENVFTTLPLALLEVVDDK